MFVNGLKLKLSKNRWGNYVTTPRSSDAFEPPHFSRQIVTSPTRNSTLLEVEGYDQHMQLHITSFSNRLI